MPPVSEERSPPLKEMLILERESSILLLVVIVEFLSIGLTIKLYRNCEQMTATFQVKTVMAESLVSIGDSAIFVIYMNNSGMRMPAWIGSQVKIHIDLSSMVQV